jgi:hypothetical protein
MGRQNQIQTIEDEEEQLWQVSFLTRYLTLWDSKRE